MRIGEYVPSQHNSLIELLVEVGEYYSAAGPPTARDVAAHLDASLAAPSSPITLVTAEVEHRVVRISYRVSGDSLVELAGTHAV